jgi:hypothetical protein
VPYVFDPELAPWIPRITDLPFANLAAARQAVKELTANLPIYQPMTRRVRCGHRHPAGAYGAVTMPCW